MAIFPNPPNNNVTSILARAYQKYDKSIESIVSDVEQKTKPVERKLKNWMTAAIVTTLMLVSLIVVLVTGSK